MKNKTNRSTNAQNKQSETQNRSSNKACSGKKSSETDAKNCR